LTPHWVGIVGTGLVMLAFVPQIVLLLRTRRAGALSVKSSALNTTASGVLFVYETRHDPSRRWHPLVGNPWNRTGGQGFLRNS